jgi:type I restriction enzyme S subunit
VLNIGDLEPFVTSGSRGWAKYYSDQGAPFLRITNMSRETIYLDLSDLKLVQLPAAQSEAERTQLQNGDVLISITADIGIIGYVSSHVQSPAYINQHIALVRFDPTRTESKFVSYFLASEGPQKLFRSLTDQGAKAGMSLLTVRKIALVHPRVEEQRAIAGALSDVDALIGALEKLIAKKRAIKLATSQQLLTGQTRLPGFGKPLGTIKSDIGIIPQDEKSEANPYCDVVIATGLGYARDFLTAYSADAIIIVEGGVGSMIEAAAAYQKRIPIVALKGSGGTADKIGGTYLDERKIELVLGESSPEKAVSTALSLIESARTKSGD